MAKNDKLITLNASDYVIYRKKTEAEWNDYVTKHEALWKAAGDKIKTTREKLKLSKKALAQASGICVKTLTKLENGQYIRRFKTVSKSCLNALGLNALKEFLALQEIVGNCE